MIQVNDVISGIGARVRSCMPYKESLNLTVSRRIPFAILLYANLAGQDEFDNLSSSLSCVCVCHQDLCINTSSNKSCSCHW